MISLQLTLNTFVFMYQYCKRDRPVIFKTSFIILKKLRNYIPSFIRTITAKERKYDIDQQPYLTIYIMTHAHQKDNKYLI